MARHRTSIPEIAGLTRCPSDEIGRLRWVGCEIRNRGKRGVVDIGGAGCSPVVSAVRAAHEGGCSVVHDDERMQSGGSLEGVGLPKGQDQCWVSDVRKAEWRGTRRIGPVKVEISRAIISKSEGDSLGYRVSTWADERGNGVRHRRQHEKARCDAVFN